MSARRSREVWLDRAACLEHDPELWFQSGVGVSERTELHWAAARAVCAECPVRAECLEAHLSEADGMFGGLTPLERKALRRRRRLTPKA